MRWHFPAAFTLMVLTTLLHPSQAEARDVDKRPLFNTFYMSSGGGTYRLDLNQDRTFSLRAPNGERVYGTFHASNREIGLVSSDASRHFRYWFDARDNLTLQPTRLDQPSLPHRGDVHDLRWRDALAKMPPYYRGDTATFVAEQNYGPPRRPPYGHRPPWWRRY